MLTVALALTLSLVPPGSAVAFNQKMNPQEQAMANLLVEHETRINNQDAVSFSQIFTEDGGPYGARTQAIRWGARGSGQPSRRHSISSTSP
jgi:hypothetical protein